MPWSAAETLADEECLDEDGDGECDVGTESTHAEDGTDTDGAAKDEQEQQAADDGVEPDGIDRRVRVPVNPADPRRAGKAIVTGVAEAFVSGSSSISHAP